jgi:hypothetical protein
MRLNELKRGLVAAAIALILTGGFVAALVAELDQPPINAGLHAETVHSRAEQPVRFFGSDMAFAQRMVH